MTEDLRQRIIEWLIPQMLIHNILTYKEDGSPMQGCGFLITRTLKLGWKERGALSCGVMEFISSVNSPMQVRVVTADYCQPVLERHFKGMPEVLKYTASFKSNIPQFHCDRPASGASCNGTQFCGCLHVFPLPIPESTDTTDGCAVSYQAALEKRLVAEMQHRRTVPKAL